MGAWTVNKPGRMRRRIAAGYDMLITDRPGQARSLVEERRQPPL